jgi:hypothetical protein
VTDIYMCAFPRPTLWSMKRFGVSILLIGTLILSALPGANAAVTPGSKCSKAGVKQTYKGKVFTCIKLGSKLYWNNGVIQKKITPIKVYAVGDVGPGGGIVFYKETTKKPWGQYLEVAPQGWSGSPNDPTSIWCDLFDLKIFESSDDLLNSIGNQIGDGKKNTAIMSSKCTSGAFKVNQYKGGGLSDWYLPSKMELNLLCKFARGQESNLRECNSSGVLKSGFAGFYWSSSEVSASRAWDQFFIIGNSNLSHKDHPNNSIRPIRSF